MPEFLVCHGVSTAAILTHRTDVELSTENGKEDEDERRASLSDEKKPSGPVCDAGLIGVRCSPGFVQGRAS